MKSKSRASAMSSSVIRIVIGVVELVPRVSRARRGRQRRRHQHPPAAAPSSPIRTQRIHARKRTRAHTRGRSTPTPDACAAPYAPSRDRGPTVSEKTTNSTRARASSSSSSSSSSRLSRLPVRWRDARPALVPRRPRAMVATASSCAARRATASADQRLSANMELNDAYAHADVASRPPRARNRAKHARGMFPRRAFASSIAPRDVNAPDGVDSVITLKKTLEKQPRLTRVSASLSPANASVTRARAHKRYTEPCRARATARDGGDGAHG